MDRRQFLRSAFGVIGLAYVAPVAAMAADSERGAAFTGYNVGVDLDMLDAAMRIPGWETFWRRYYAGLTPEAYEAGQRTILRVHGLEHAKQTAAEHAHRLSILHLPNPYRGLDA